jgi:hypothetical protein
MINKYKKQTAAAIITCNRQDFFNKLEKSIDRNAIDKLYVICAGDTYEKFPDDVIVIHPQNKPCVVGHAKNIALQRMRDDGYVYLFLIEDDIEITNNSVFEKYIQTAADSGLWFFQLSYATHGSVAGGNVLPDGTPNKLHTIQYSKTKVDIYRESFAAFSMTHRDIFAITGNDVFYPEYLNACEHLDTHMLLSQKTPSTGLPFYTFADIHNSFEYIKDLSPNHQDSVIRKDPKFLEKFLNGAKLFEKRWKVRLNQIDKPSPVTLMGKLEELEQLYSNKSII